MTGRDVSAAFTAASTAEATDEVPLVLLTVDHDELDAPIRVCDNIEAITSNGNTFLALPFDVELPDDGERPGEARVRIDNVSRDIALVLRRISTPPLVTIQVVLASQPDTIEYEITNLTLRDATYDLNYVSGFLRFEDLTTEAVAEIITPQRFPALF